MIKPLLIVNCIICISSALHAREQQVATDTLPGAEIPFLKKEEQKLFPLKKLVVPASLITFGVFTLSNHSMSQLNESTRYEINEHQPRKMNADNYTQYVPAALVYGLNMSGVKGEHNFRDRSIILATSQLAVAAMVIPLKYAVHKERPDGSNFHSFPSGHTATAFSTAQFMFREYRKRNVWLSLAGYPFAIFTGVYRTVNNKHWVGDVAAGAGIGILSTELSYALFPKISKLLRRKTNDSNSSFYPYFNGRSAGIGFVKQF